MIFKSRILQYSSYSILAVGALFWSLAGCSPVEFKKGGGAQDCTSGVEGCSNSGGIHYDYDAIVPASKVDILFVDDNSASMSTEQKVMAARFNGFISKLDAAGADYRIAITTTDISSTENPARTINQNGALQDGALIAFSNGSSYLTPSGGSLSQNVNMFNQAIVRPETLQCEDYILNFLATYGKAKMGSNKYRSGYLANCPADDERGIYAANLVVKNNPKSFLRKDASLAIVVLADEDERSQYYDPYFNIQGYALEDLDQPATFIRNLLNAGTSKSFTFHSIIVKDETCKGQQQGQLNSLAGSTYGNLYAKLTNLSGGVLGDICASTENYTSQLSAITGKILSSIQAVPLKCSAPQKLNVTINGTTPVFSVVNFKLIFGQKVAPGASIHLSYDCPY